MTIRRRAWLPILFAALALAPASPAGAIGPPCPETPKSKCYGLESLEASLSISKEAEEEGIFANQAGAHPDLSFGFEVKQDPEAPVDEKSLHNVYAPTRDVRVELPPGLIGDPSVLGVPNQCTVLELTAQHCPIGSQIGIAEVNLYKYGTATEPLYMMAPPGGNVVARVGFIAYIVPVYTDLTVRSDGDYGLTSEIGDAASEANLVKTRVTLWGVPADPVHETERCTPEEVFLDHCVKSLPREAGSRELPFITNPTRCGVPLEMSVSASSWAEPDRFDKKSVSFPQTTGCDKLPYGPGLTIEPTNHRAGAPTGLDITARVPGAEGVKVLEPSQTRDVRVTLPAGMSINPGAEDGLDVCSEAQVHFGKNVAAECPDAAKLAGFEVEIPALPRRMKGAVYLREPEPGNLFRFWAVADDLGFHVKLQGQLNVDKQTGQLESTVLEIPQAPVREMKIVFKSGFRAPLINPRACGTYASKYEFVPWSGGAPQVSNSQMTISEGCEAGVFSPKISAGSTDAQGGAHSPFTFTLTREDGEENIDSLDLTLPRGMAATFAGVGRCEGAAAESGQCPADSRVGRVTAAAGAGPAPLWLPQPGKRPTAVYLAGPYKGAPLSFVTVVPAQAGPFDLGDQVVRAAVYVDPDTAQATTKTDPLPQIVEGIPVLYRAANVFVDRSGFTLNPTSCAQKQTTATVRSSEGASASPSSPYAAVNCGILPFKPKIALRLRGGTHRGAHPSLSATLAMPPGGANIAATSVALPHSEFLDQAHIKTVCTRVQFKAGNGNGEQCPAGSIYGHVKATTPLLEEPIEGNIYLRSSDHPLPDMVMALKGPPSLPIAINAVGRVDSVNGGIRSTFESVPDAPVTELVATFPGGKKGLIVNSTNLCAQVNKVTAKFTAQNGKQTTLHPALQSKCKKPKKGSRPRAGSR